MYAEKQHYGYVVDAIGSDIVACPDFQIRLLLGKALLSVEATHRSYALARKKDTFRRAGASRLGTAVGLLQALH